mmetsp:Transcript_9852/g.28321  ORF Transcript_9852/g.28321 Transcript_9852/m.28321 type:complete len:115 (-) Transcript_9852:94-438(-)
MCVRLARACWDPQCHCARRPLPDDDEEGADLENAAQSAEGELGALLSTVLGVDEDSKPAGKKAAVKLAKKQGAAAKVAKPRRQQTLRRAAVSAALPLAASAVADACSVRLCNRT